MGLSLLSQPKCGSGFRGYLMMLALFFGSLPSIVVGQDGDGKKQEGVATVENAIEVDEKQKTPIFVFDVSGGMRLAPIEKQQPSFQLFADGRIVAGGNSGALAVNGKLTPEELSAFLKLVVNTHDFFGIVQAKVVEKIKAGKQPVVLADAPFTKFMIDIKKGKNSISIYALFNTIKSYPKMGELTRLQAIEAEVTRLSAKVHLGEDAEEVLKVVNEAVKNNKDHKIEPFTMAEMSRATRLPNHRFQVQFTRQAKAEGPRPAGAPPLRELNVIYFKKDKISEPAVSFYGLPAKKK